MASAVIDLTDESDEFSRLADSHPRLPLPGAITDDYSQFQQIKQEVSVPLNEEVDHVWVPVSSCFDYDSITRLEHLLVQ